MITGLHLAEHACLSKVAGRIAGTAQLESKTRHLRRFLGNDDVDPEQFYSPVRDCLIKWAVRGTETDGGGLIRLLVDTVELSGERQVLMAAIAYRRRALPICWKTYRRGGVTNAEQQTSLLRSLAGRFPDDTEVVIVGDGAFHSTDLMDFIEGQGWHFCLRLHRDTHVRSTESSSEENTWRQLRYLIPEEGERRYLRDVIVTKDNEYGPINLALCHAEDEDDPWLICTDREAGYAALRTYSRRMWIEQLFADLEDGGFHLNRSRIYPPDRLSRLAGGTFVDVRLAPTCRCMDGQTRISVEGRPDQPSRPKLRGTRAALASAVFDQSDSPSDRSSALFLKLSGSQAERLKGTAALGHLGSEFRWRPSPSMSQWGLHLHRRGRPVLQNSPRGAPPCEVFNPM